MKAQEKSYLKRGKKGCPKGKIKEKWIQEISDSNNLQGRSLKKRK
jgi:hypothetical protein